MKEAYGNLLGKFWNAGRLSHWVPVVLRCLLVARSVPRSEFLSYGRRRTVSLACPGADWNAD